MFGDKPVRIVLIDGIPNFSLCDICEALGLNDYAAQHINDPDFPGHAKRIVEEHGPDGIQAVTVLTPVGVWLWTAFFDAGRGQKLAAWVKREAYRICANPRDRDPAMCLTLLDGDRLPPRPLKFSGWRSAWYDLKDARLSARISGRGMEALRAAEAVH